MNAIKVTAIALTLAATIVTGAIAQGNAGLDFSQSHLTNEQLSRRAKVREHILWSLKTSLDKLYNWDGFGKHASYNVRSFRNLELAAMTRLELTSFYALTKLADWEYDRGIISIKELGEVYYGPIHWRAAAGRPDFHQVNQHHYKAFRDGGGVDLWTNADSYVDAYGGFDRWFAIREKTMRRVTLEQGAWLSADVTFANDVANGHPDTLHFGYDVFFGETIMMDELEWHGLISFDERKRHFEGIHEQGDVISPDLP